MSHRKSPKTPKRKEKKNHLPQIVTNGKKGFRGFSASLLREFRKEQPPKIKDIYHK